MEGREEPSNGEEKFKLRGTSQVNRCLARSAGVMLCRVCNLICKYASQCHGMLAVRTVCDEGISSKPLAPASAFASPPATDCNLHNA